MRHLQGGSPAVSRRRLRREPRRRPRVRTGRHARRAATRLRARTAGRTVAHQHLPARRARQGPRPRPPVGARTRSLRSGLEPAQTGVDGRLAAAPRLPRPAPRGRRQTRRCRARGHPGRRGRRPPAQHPTTGVAPAQRRAADPARRAGCEEGSTGASGPREEGRDVRVGRGRRGLQKDLDALAQYVARGGRLPGRGVAQVLPDGTEHCIGVWIGNIKARRDKLNQAQLAALAQLGVDWAWAVSSCLRCRRMFARRHQALPSTMGGQGFRPGGQRRYITYSLPS